MWAVAAGGSVCGFEFVIWFQVCLGFKVVGGGGCGRGCGRWWLVAVGWVFLYTHIKRGRKKERGRDEIASKKN